MKSINHILLGIVFVVCSLYSSQLMAQVGDQQVTDGADVVSAVNESEDHAIFAGLLEEAELTETLSMAGPFTVLAPTDEVFEEMSDELAELRENPQQLQNMVINHLFQGEVPATEVEEQLGVNVVDGDIEASNGVVHHVDEIVTPAQPETPQN